MFKKVLVPLDGSKLAECALSSVISLAKEGSIGEVILLTVAEMEISYSNVGEEFIFQTFWGNKLDESRKYLEGVQSRLRAEGIKTEMVVSEGGRPAQVIAEYAQAGIDMIVIATHGYTGLKKMLLGSVALRVLHESHVPVLLIRPKSCQL